MTKSKATPIAAWPRLATAGSALLLAMQAAAQPAPQSLSEVSACSEDDSTAFVCSTKDLSNVILQCGDESGSTYVKFDDDPDDGSLPIDEESNQGSFSCPEGNVLAVFVKSGSAFNTDATIAGLPRGSGAMINLEACTAETLDCPDPDADEDEGGDEGGDEGNDEAGAAAAQASGAGSTTRTTGGAARTTGEAARATAISRRPPR